MSKAGRVASYLGHNLHAIERIDRYTAEMDELVFLANELVQDAVIRNIEIIGEAATTFCGLIPNSPHDMTTSPGWSCTRCEIVSRTATTRWTWKSSGRRCNVICRYSTRRLHRWSQTLALS